jgi:hypothetical protein
MKFATISKSLVMGFVLLLAVGAFAANKATISLQHSATINGTTLKPGDYKFEWDGAGPNVEVSISQGKKLIAKVPAKMVNLGSRTPNDAAVFTTANGNSTLSGLRFSGKTYGLDLSGQSSDDMQAGSTK